VTRCSDFWLITEPREGSSLVIEVPPDQNAEHVLVHWAAKHNAQALADYQAGGCNGAFSEWLNGEDGDDVRFVRVGNFFGYEARG